MGTQALPIRLSTILRAARPQYLGASVAPVLVGSALGYTVGGSFHLGLFALATLAIMALHAGAYFYTAGPLRLGYRGVGEIVIGILFGILPVYASYYLQTQTVDLLPLLPALRRARRSSLCRASVPARLTHGRTP